MSKRKQQIVQFARFSAAETAIAYAIARRALQQFKSLHGFDGLEDWGLVMDLQAVAYHTPLRLADLSLADDFNFAHDVLGIFRNLDRTTGKFCNDFEPRFAVRRAA